MEITFNRHISVTHTVVESARALASVMKVEAMAFSYSSEIETRILAKAAEDEGFRAQLIADPKAAISGVFGLNLPEWFDIQVHRNTATAKHLILPPSDLLVESELEMVAGGEDMQTGPPPSPPEQDFPG